MKKKITGIFLLFTLIFSLILAFFSYGFLIPSDISSTYYGELEEMYNNLYSTKGKKIVIIGNSSVAFGVRSDLIEKEIADYEVCNFGLYGNLGTKMMLDLSKKAISKDDIVIIALEQYKHAHSLYFDGNEAWYGINGNLSMLSKINSENQEAMLGSYFNYLNKKHEFINNNIDTVYAKSSFDNNCNMIYPRNNNVMENGYDSNNLITPNKDMWNDEFVNYLNEYYSYCYKKGAKVYYGFCPMNKSAIAANTNFSSYYSFIQSSLNFPVLGNPNDYVYEANWFYNSNFHLNTNGAILHTKQLVDDIKIILGDRSVNNIENPEKPPFEKVEVINGDNSFVECFNYKLNDNNTYTITSLKENCNTLKDIIIPTSYNNMAITSFSEDVFKNNNVVENIVIQANITKINSYSFDGCSNLKAIYIDNSNPSTIAVSYYSFNGCSVDVYVPFNTISSYVVDYTWSYHSSLLKEGKYEK